VENRHDPLRLLAEAVEAPRLQPPPVALAPLAPAEYEPKDESLPLSHYLWVLRRSRWKILPFIATAVICTLIVSKRLTPIYESTVTVDVDRRVPTGIIGQEAAQSTLNDADQFLATQVKLIQSDAVLRPVADRYHLRPVAEGSDQPTLRQDAPVVLRNLKVTRPPNTYLLQISYRSPDSRLSADVANAVARSYVEHTYEIRFRSSANLSTFMEKQLDELRAKMERSSAALAQFEKELNLINPADKTNILSARLLQLNTDYTNAQTERMKKEAAFHSVSTGTLESAQASAQGEALRRLAERLNDAEEKFATIRTLYGVNHPEYRKAQAQVSEVHQQFDDTRAAAVRRADVEFREGANRERMLKGAVDETKADFDRINARSFEYDARRREAEADKKLYEELVTKIREAAINAGFQSSTVRLADNARPAYQPVFPNVPLNVGLAFLFSTLLAVGAAILADTLDSAVRDSEQVVRVARAEVIAGLPRVKMWNGGLAQRDNPSGATGVVSTFEEAIRSLRTSILLGSFDRPMRSLMITSATPAEGKSTIAAHLAIANAEQKRKTLLIDCDLRRPSIDHKLGLKSDLGMTSVLLNGLHWRAAVVEYPGSPSLSVLPAGNVSRRAAGLIGGALPQILEEAAAEYDMVIVDSPPVLGFPEPLEMGAVVDGVLVIALAGKTDRKALASVISIFKRLRANVIGVALNEVTRDVGDSYYYEGHCGKYARHYQHAAQD